jgi:hypothetical protein
MASARTKVYVVPDCWVIVTVARAVSTNAVVASWVVFVPAGVVGAVGVPVKVGEARGAFPLIVETVVAEMDTTGATVAVPVTVIVPSMFDTEVTVPVPVLGGLYGGLTTP